MTPSIRATLLNAFTPSHEVIDPKLFAGRREQILDLVDALQSAGKIPLIYGDRGLGKSSLAIQTQQIAMGDAELLSSMGASDRVLLDSETFLTFYVACSDEVHGSLDLIQLLINAMEELDIEDCSQGKASKLVDRTTRKQVSFKFFQLESVKNYQTEAESIKYSNLNQREKLLKTVRALEQFIGPQRILFIIDELDRVEDLSGFASFLRNTSSPYIRFMLIGAMRNISDLHISHPSVLRSLGPINVPRMTRGEMADVVDRTVAALGREGLQHRFNDQARMRLVRMAGGFPWFLHVIGQQALAATADSGQPVVTEDDIIRAIRTLISKRFAEQFADLYQLAVRTSTAREKVLRVFAAWPERDISTRGAYELLRTMGVTNPGIYKGHLCSDHYGEVLISSQYQSGQTLRFRSEMFRQYIYLRPSLCENVDIEVEEAIREVGG